MSSQNTPAEPTKASPTGQASNATQEQLEKLRFLENDPARTGFDPKTAWWMSLFKIWMGQTTPEGAFHYREWRTRVNEQKDCKRCEDYRDHLFRHSPIVRFMSDKIKDLNGELNSENVRCRRCVTKITEDGKVARQGGGFSPNHGILICANEVRNRGHLEDTLTHEMVHAWDYLRWKVDFVGEKDLKHAACTEIRASMLSGECRFARESMTRGHWKLTQQFQDCVRARAVASVMHRPMCKDDVQAVKVVNQVWDSCFNDTRPFDEVYR